MHDPVIYHYAFRVGRNFAFESTVDGIVLQQMCKGGRVGQVIDGNQFKLGTFLNDPGKRTAYSTEAIDGYSDILHPGVRLRRQRWLHMKRPAGLSRVA